MVDLSCCMFGTYVRFLHVYRALFSFITAAYCNGGKLSGSRSFTLYI